MPNDCRKNDDQFILVRFVDKQAVLQELQQVLKYVQDNSVFQDWI